MNVKPKHSLTHVDVRKAARLFSLTPILRCKGDDALCIFVCLCDRKACVFSMFDRKAETVNEAIAVFFCQLTLFRKNMARGLLIVMKI